MTRRQRRSLEEGRYREWNGGYRSYDLVKEASIALGVDCSGEVEKDLHRLLKRVDALPLTLDLLHLLTDDVVCGLHLGHAVVDTGGQALELGVRTAATVGIEVTLERSTDVSQCLRHA